MKKLKVKKKCYCNLNWDTEKEKMEISIKEYPKLSRKKKKYVKNIFQKLRNSFLDTVWMYLNWKDDSICVCEMRKLFKNLKKNENKISYLLKYKETIEFLNRYFDYVDDSYIAIDCEFKIGFPYEDDREGMCDGIKILDYPLNKEKGYWADNNIYDLLEGIGKNKDKIKRIKNDKELLAEITLFLVEMFGKNFNNENNVGKFIEYMEFQSTTREQIKSRDADEMER